MIKIKCYIRRNCDACKIMLRIITDVITDINIDCAIRVINVENLSIDEKAELNINKFPLTIIEKDDNNKATLKGTYPIEFIENVILNIEKA